MGERCRAGLEGPLDGVGFVAPKGEAEVIAGPWVSSKWDGRAPDDQVLVRAFLGGARAKVAVAKTSDADLARIAQRALGQPASYPHLRAHETVLELVCRLLLGKTTIYKPY